MGPRSSDRRPWKARTQKEDSRVTMEADTEVPQPQAKDARKQPEPEPDQAGRTFSWGLRRGRGLPTHGLEFPASRTMSK